MDRGRFVNVLNFLLPKGTAPVLDADSVVTMKTFIIALIGLFALTLGAPTAEARDKDRDRKHYKKHSSKYCQSDRHYRSYRSYPRSTYYRSNSYPRYYSYPQSYSYYRQPYYGQSYYGDRYSYSRRPAISFSFGL